MLNFLLDLNFKTKIAKKHLFVPYNVYAYMFCDV